MCYLLLLSWDTSVSRLQAGCQKVVTLDPQGLNACTTTHPCTLSTGRGWRPSEGDVVFPPVSPGTLKTPSWKWKYWQIFLSTWKYCCHSQWQSAERPSPPLPLFPVRWGGEGSGLGQSGSSTFWQIKCNQRSWLREESWCVRFPTTDPMKLCGSISVWKYFSFQTLGGRVGYGKSLLKSWNCSQKADT